MTYESIGTKVFDMLVDTGTKVLDKAVNAACRYIGKRTARRCLGMTLDYLEAQVPRRQMPEIQFSTEHGTSQYDIVDNVLALSDNHLESGPAHFEESFHFGRTFLTGRVGKPLHGWSEIFVDEFFGRLGESIGRRLVKGTNLEYLFAEEERFHSDPEYLGQILRVGCQRLVRQCNAWAAARVSGLKITDKLATSPVPFAITDLNELDWRTFETVMGNLRGYVAAELYMRQNPNYFEDTRRLMREDSSKIRRLIEGLKHPEEARVAEIAGCPLNWFF